MRVVVDVQVRVALHPIVDKVHECFEGRPLLAPVVGPEGAKLGLALLDETRAEEVLEPAFLERIAFHVEEHIALVGPRQTEEAAMSVGIERKDLDGIAARGCPRHLKARLRGELGHRFRLQARNTCARAYRRELRHREDARIAQPLDLVAPDSRDLVQVILAQPLLGAKVAPRTHAAMLAALRPARPRLVAVKAMKRSRTWRK